jgi:hypothetical protein
MQPIAICAMIFQQSCVDEFIQVVGGTGRDGKCRFL